MGTIPASIDVNVLPGVIGAGGTELSTIGLLLDSSAAIPIAPLGSVLSFPDATSVEDYFGAGTVQADLASKYFNGFTNRTAIPSALLFSQYPSQPVAAYLRGGALTSTLAQLQAYTTGSLTAVVDGYTHVIASIDLSAQASFSAVASALTAAFTNPTEAAFTGQMGSAFTATGSSTTLTVSAVASGYISVGDVLTGTGIPASTTIVAQLTGTAGSTGTYQTSVATTAIAASCTATSSNIYVSAVSDDGIATGQTVSGGSVQVGTLVTSQISGTAGGIGVYATNVAGVPTKQTSASASLTAKATAPVMTYSSLYGAFVLTSGITGAPSTSAYATGTLSTPMALTAATGAVLSQGAAATSPAVFMAALIAQNQNFVSFSTTFDPDAAFFTGTISGTTLTIDTLATGTPIIGDTLSGPGVTTGTVIVSGSGSTWVISPSQTVSAPVNMTAWAAGGGHGNTNKLAFAAWNNSVPNRFAYAMWDTDISPTLSSAATGSAGYIVNNLAYSGIIPIYEPSDLGHQAFLMGVIASLNFDQTNGRQNFKFRTQAGLTPAVTDLTVATNLGSGASTGSNGYNFVAAVATAAEQLIYWRDGQISGEFGWIDSYINQIWLNAYMQRALLGLLTAVGSVPYNPAGYNMISTTLTGGATSPIVLPPQSPVAAAINFGAIRPNVPLSAAQAETVNSEAGEVISGILSTRGWYLQVLAPTPEVRAARGSPVCNLWYTDGQSINTITLSSTEIE